MPQPRRVSRLMAYINQFLFGSYQEEDGRGIEFLTSAQDFIGECRAALIIEDKKEHQKLFHGTSSDKSINGCRAPVSENCVAAAFV